MFRPTNIRDGANAAAGEVGKWDKSGAVGAFAQLLVLAIFALFDELFIKTNFKCPCIDPSSREESCERSLTYSVLFILLTTLLAGFLGTAALIGISRKIRGAKKPTDNKKPLTSAEANDEGTSTGKARRRPPQQNLELRERGSGEPRTRGALGQEQSDVIQRKKACLTIACSRRDLITGVVQFLLVSTAWAAVLCIDGDYVACTLTCHPYGNATCSEVRSADLTNLPFSAEFERIKTSVSQPIGISLALFVAVLFLVSLACNCSTQWKNADTCCAFKKDEEGQARDTNTKINEAKQLLSEAEPGAYIIKNV